jgi:predicted MPP superfamily phosphohydrolase
MISDTHFGISQNNLDKFLPMMEETFYQFVIPFLKKNVERGDILIHLGDLFDNRTSIPILVLNRVEKILRDISDILPIHILVGNHDLWNKGSNDINSVRIFGYINNNISVYEKTSVMEIDSKKIILMPWIEKRVDMISEIDDNPGDYLFCHSDLNGCRMHLNSVAHRNPDKIDVENFRGYKDVFSGHIHITQKNNNFRFVGSLYQMDRNDINDQKGITILDLSTGDIHFEPNRFSPVFRKVSVKNEEDIENLDQLKDSRDYIDLLISNSLLIGNRKLRRKLESLLETGNFSSVEYLDDIVKEDSEINESIDVENELDISIQLDYDEVIRKYIQDQKWDSEKIKLGILGEFEEIIRIYKEEYKEHD